MANIQNVKSGNGTAQSTTAARWQDQNPFDLIQKAYELRCKANVMEDKANERQNRLREDIIREQQIRALRGNDQAAKMTEAALEVLVDERCSKDDRWNSYVSRNKFYMRKANMENTMAQAIMAGHAAMFRK